MTKEQQALENKINEFDKYMSEHFDPANPSSIYESSEYAKYGQELYDLTNKCGSFNTPEEIELRNRSLVQMQLVKIVNDVKVTAFDDSKVPEEGSPARASYDEQIKVRDQAMLKYSCAVSGLKKGEEHVSKAIDLDVITWVQSTEPEKLQESLGASKLDKMMELDPSSPLFGMKNKSFGTGGMTAYTYLIPSKDGKGYELDKAKGTEKMMTDLFKDARLSEMVSSYQKAEKSWLSSAMTPTQEIENRLRFVNAYDKELKSLYFMMNSEPELAPEAKETVNKFLEDKGIRELVKDFKTFKDPENKKTEFLMSDANKYEKSFRKEYKGVADKLNDSLPKNEKLAEFHQFMLSYGDYGTGVSGNVANTTKQVRPFIDNFMAMPEKDQLKALYMLENKMYKNNEPVTDEMLKDYTPDVKKCKSVMKASNFKFWKRANSSYIYWQKLKTCTDKVYDKAHIEEKKKSKSKIALKLGKIVTKVGSLFSRLKLHNIKGANALAAASAVLGSASAISNMAKESSVTTGAQKADVIMGEAGKLVNAAKTNTLINMVSTKNFVLMQQFQGLAVAANAIMTVKSVANTVTNAKNLDKTKALAEDIKNLKDDKTLTDDGKKIAQKLEANTRMLKVINKDKVKISTAETVKNGVSLGCSTAMLSGVGVAALIPQAVVGIGTKIYEGQVRKNDTVNVIDAKLYENDAQKDQKIKETQAQMIGRFARLPKKLQNKYVDQVADIYYDKKKVSAQIRQEAVRESGEVNLTSTKNSYVKQAGQDAYDILKSGAKKAKTGELTELDMKFVDLANKFIVSTGGKEIDIKTMETDTPQAAAQEQMAVNRIAKNMTV